MPMPLLERLERERLDLERLPPREVKRPELLRRTLRRLPLLERRAMIAPPWSLSGLSPMVARRGKTAL